MGDDPDVKDEMDMDEDEQMEDESVDEAGKENPEASEIREIRNRLETLEFNHFSGYQNYHQTISKPGADHFKGYACLLQLLFPLILELNIESCF